MIGIPDNTSVNKTIPKIAIFDKFALSSKEKERINNDISKIIISNEISPKSIPALKDGKDCHSIFIITILLKRMDYSPSSIALIAKYFPKHIVISAEYEDKEEISIFHNSEQLKTKWQKKDTHELPLSGINMDDIWENMHFSISGYKKNGKSFNDIHETEKKKAELRYKIEQLELKIRKELQAKRKYGLYNEMEKLKKELDGIDG